MDTFYGVAEVAKLCGMRADTITNWHYRTKRWPVPPAVVIKGVRRDHYGWRASQMPDWLKWAAGTRKETP